MDSDAHSRITPQLVIGALIIAVGVLLTLDNLGRIDAERYLIYWPAGLILIGLVKLAQVRHPAGWLVAGIWIVVGTWLLLENLDLVDQSFWDYWPLLIVATGGVVVWRALSGRAERGSATDSNDRLNAVAILSGVTRRSDSANFRGGEFTAIMGGCEVDLREASIAGGEAVIDTFAMWGGIEIAVPKDWTVVGKGFALLGGWEDKTQPPKGGSKQRLIIRGMAIMGGVEVKN